MEETSQAHAASRPNRGAATDRAHTNSRSLQICNRVVFAYRIRQTRQLRPPDSRQARPKKTQPPADNRGSRTALERLGGLNGLDGPTRQLTTDRQDTADRDRIVATQSAVSRQILLSLPRRHCMAGLVGLELGNACARHVIELLLCGCPVADARSARHSAGARPRSSNRKCAFHHREALAGLRNVQELQIAFQSHEITKESQ